VHNHECSALRFHKEWESEGWVLMRSVKSCPRQPERETSCYEGTDDPLEAADWLTRDPSGFSYWIKGGGGEFDDDAGWTQVGLANFHEETSKLRWIPSIAAAMEIAACWNWRDEDEKGH
jgi:hypothetical protein